MSPSPQIGLRGKEILTAIVQTYIATGEPVGSRTLARESRERLSAATIRNVMSDLTEAGFLEQPHTSAGRVPTAEAYRYYVEQISGKAVLSRGEQEKIEDSFHGVSDVEDFMERTSHVLSLISSGVGVAVTLNVTNNTLEHIYFSRLGDQKILAVVVTKSGVVKDRVLRVAHDLSQGDLDLAANYINENFRGWSMEKLRTEVAHRLEETRSEYDRMMRSVEQLYRQGALSADETPQGIYVEGVSNLVGDQQDRERLRQLLKTLEEKQRVAELLAAYVDAQQEAVRVVIGLEDAVPHMRNFVLIGAPARVGNEVMGSLAVLGPTRIDYEHSITAVSYIARLFDRILNQAEESK